MNRYTTIGEGLPVEVSFDWHPGRPVKLHGDDAHPEEPAELEITKIVVVSVSVVFMTHSIKRP